MINLFGSESLVARAVLTIALDVTLKATVLLALTLAAHAALGHRRALVRSALWNSCLAGLLFMPAASWGLPRLRIVVLPIMQERVQVKHAAGGIDTVPARVVPTNAPAPVANASPPALERRAVNPVEFAAAPASSSPGFTFHETWQPDWKIVVIGVYLGIVTILVVKLARALIAVGRLRQACEPVDSPAWATAAKFWRGRLRIMHSVTILHSDRVSIPMVLGWLQPAIVLPRRLVVGAGPEVIDAVIVHELGHVKRGDYAWNLVLRVVRIVYWPQPLVWLAGRLIGALREQACDDLCVHVLGGPSTYRRSLVEVASGMVRRADPAIGLAMARTTSLGRRLAWIAHSRGVSRCLLRWPARWALAVVVVASAGALGAVELARKAANAMEQPPAKVVEHSPDAPLTMPPAIDIMVIGKDSNRPLAGARIRASLDFDEPLLKTDHEGLAHIDLSKLVFRDRFGVDVWADGYVQQRHFFGTYDPQNPRIPDRLTIALLPGEETLGGKVTNEEGRPIAGARVVLWGYLGEKKEPHEMGYMFDTIADANGEWRCRSCRKMTFAYLYLSHPDYAADEHSHPRAHSQPKEGKPYSPDDPAMKSLRDFSDVQVMARGVAIKGTVVDKQGRPVANAEVGRLEASQLENTFSWDMPKTATDAEGRFEFPHVRPGAYALQVKASGHAPELKLVTARESSESVSIELDKSHVLSGRVVNAQNKPIANADVYISGWRGSEALGVNLKTDKDGRFRWEDAPADSVRISAGREGYDGAELQTVRADDGPVLFTFKRVLSISGKLTDAATNHPIERAIVEVAAADAKGDFALWSTPKGVNAFRGSFQASLDAEERPAYRLRIKAKGYEPLETRTFGSEEKKVTFNVKLTKLAKPEGVVVSGIVRQSNDRPLAGADVAITYPMGGVPAPSVHIENGKIRPAEGQTVVKTDAQGRFSIAREPDPAGQFFAVVVVHPDFYAEVARSAFESDPTINVRPWGRIEGVARSSKAPAAGSVIRYSGDRLGSRDVPYVHESGQTTATDQGEFVFDRVIPGEVRAYFDRKENFPTHSTLVEVRAGATARAELGGRGRPVIAKVVPPAGFDPKADYSVYSEFELRSDRDVIPYPKEILAKHEESTTIWVRQWWTSAEGRQYRQNYERFIQMRLRPDGTIRVEDVPPGDYRLNLTYSAYPLRSFRGTNDQIAHAVKQFTIPEIPGRRSDEPFDLGVLRPKLKATLEVGQLAPALDVESLDGTRLRLVDYRGKYVLLDFWATWCGPCVADVPEFRKVFEQFGKDPRFAMLSLSLDAEKDAPRTFVKEKGLAWAQGFLGDTTDGGVQDAFHVESIPAIFLIGPDGKIFAKNLNGPEIGAAVARALQAP